MRILKGLTFSALVFTIVMVLQHQYLNNLFLEEYLELSDKKEEITLLYENGFDSEESVTFFFKKINRVYTDIGNSAQQSLLKSNKEDFDINTHYIHFKNAIRDE